MGNRDQNAHREIIPQAANKGSTYPVGHVSNVPCRGERDCDGELFLLRRF